MRFAREMCLRHMKYADAYEDLFHFILRPKGAIFYNDPVVISHSTSVEYFIFH